MADSVKAAALVAYRAFAPNPDDQAVAAVGLHDRVFRQHPGAAVAQDGSVALGWLALAYCLHTTGELCLSPVGLSMVTMWRESVRLIS